MLYACRTACYFCYCYYMDCCSDPCCAPTAIPTDCCTYSVRHQTWVAFCGPCCCFIVFFFPPSEQTLKPHSTRMIRVNDTYVPVHMAPGPRYLAHLRIVGPLPSRGVRSYPESYRKAWGCCCVIPLLSRCTDYYTDYEVGRLNAC